MRRQEASVPNALDLRGAARRAHSALYAKWEQMKWMIRSRLLRSWIPLVPEAEFMKCFEHALCVLRAKEVKPVVLEFGVSRGTSLACMHRVLSQHGITDAPMFGFDSFKGMPLEAASEGWLPGAYRSTLSATKRNLELHGVDLNQVTLIKGWFRDTLTEETRKRCGIERATVIMIDCDTYSASRDALQFCEPLIKDCAIVILDDWGSDNKGELSQADAFSEFLREHPRLSIEPLPAYRNEARVFFVQRESVV